MSAPSAAGALRMWLSGDTPRGALVRELRGRVGAGSPRAGLDIVLLPSAVSASVASATGNAASGEICLTLESAVAVAPEDIVVAEAEGRPEVADQVAAELAWTGGHAMLPGRSYKMQLGPQAAEVQVTHLKHRIGAGGAEPIAARTLAAGEVGLVNLSFSRPLVFDAAETGGPLSRFEVSEREGGGPVGHGTIRFALRRATNIHWQSLAVDRAARARIKGQRPACLWFTGLSGSGKSTVASLVEKRLHALGLHTYTLDGDNVRHGLNRDLGFTEADRVENIRRVAEVARLFVDAGLITMVSFISPFRAERQMARALFADGEFLEIFLDTPLEVCERRDPKGLYRKARTGQLVNFTGIDSPYEPPLAPEVRLPAAQEDPDALVERLMAELARSGIV